MGRPMTDRATRLRELEEMAAKLLATARKLPRGPDRNDILQEIGRFRVQIIALKAAGSRPARRGLKAKGKCQDHDPPADAGQNARRASSGTRWMPEGRSHTAPPTLT